MRLEYTPNGASGYVCELVGAVGALVTVRVAGGATEFEVSSNDLPMQAAVAAVGQYASHEYEGRRTRDVTKRRHHEKQATRWRQAAEEIGELLYALTDSAEHGWCSDCMTEADHRLVRLKTRFGTKRYVCTACRSPTGWCDVPRQWLADPGRELRRPPRPLQLTRAAQFGFHFSAAAVGLTRPRSSCCSHLSESFVGDASKGPERMFRSD